MQMLRAIPLLGLTPLLILWFGISEVPKITLIALARKLALLEAVAMPGVSGEYRLLRTVPLRP